MDTIVLSPELLAKWYLVAVITLIPLVNPFSTIPLLLSLTRGMSPEDRLSQATRAAIYSAILMQGTLLIGSGVLMFFNISVPALRIAGGLVVAFLGFQMLFPAPRRESMAASEQTQGGQTNHALIPLAFPSLCGAGTMALLISYSSAIEAASAGMIVKLSAHGVLSLAIITVAFLAGWLLRSANVVAMRLGQSGMEAIERIMGLLMVCIGVQFIATGVREFASLPL
jgi:multiple antibiotic resistance protein